MRLQELKAKKKAQQETLTGRRKLLLGLATELKVLCCSVPLCPAFADRAPRALQAIKAATVPVSKLVAVADRTAVHLLPAALRTLFSVLDAVAQQPGSEERRIVVSVQGTPDLASEAEPAADVAEAGEVQEEEEGRRSTKRARTGDGGVHPMSVLLELHARGSKRAGIAFEFVPSRGLVVPRMEDGDAALLDGILGESLTDVAGGGEDGEAAPSAALVNRLSWVQKLAGLDGSPEPAHAEAVVAALHAAALRS